MAIDENKFFRQATLLICGHLEIEEAMADCIRYLNRFIPADMISLELYNSDFSAMRIIAEATPDGGRKTNRLTPLPQEARDYMLMGWEHIQKGGTLPAMVINHPETNPISRAMAEDYGIIDSSLLVLSLISGGNYFGDIVLECEDNDRYTDEHARLLTLLIEPFSKAVSNYLKHQEILTLKDRLLDENRYLHQEMQLIVGENIVGEKFGLKNVMEMVGRVASTDSPVLLLGETGVGKDVIAKAIQNASTRAEGPFIIVNCGAIPDTLLDSELFGHEKGAFTGALSKKKGRFERAHGGTIFLDEIGELPSQAQVRLLRVLQNQEIERVGGTEAIKINIRIIAATNQDLEEMVSEGEFRKDLWFRLNVFPIFIPPLKNRTMDIPSLVQHFINQKSKKINNPDYLALAPGAIDLLMEYDWPGNVRELENIIERALILNRGEPITFNNLIIPSKTHNPVKSVVQDASFLSMNEMISSHIRKALDMTGGRIQGKGGAAELLDMNANTLRSRMRKLGIETRKQ